MINFTCLNYYSMTILVMMALLQLQIITKYHAVSATKCVVSKWKRWSGCEGNCEFAQRFRNRDVVRPPFPEKDARTGEFVLRNCPHMYEVQRCMPKYCADESPFARGPPLTNIKRTQKSHYSDESSQADENDEQFGDIRSKQLNMTKVEEKVPIKRNKLAGIGILHTSRANRLECDYINPNCCKIVRTTCPHGAKATSSQIRWYRKKDDQFCRPYRYPVCTDLNESAFASENECLDECFSDVEKAVLPAFRII